VVLRGNRVHGIRAGRRYWERDTEANWLVFSSYHLNDDTLPLYIDRIRRFAPEFIQAYPSVLQMLAGAMQRQGIAAFETVRAVLCGSENLYDWQRRLFEEVLQTRVFSWYGHSERCCLAGECEVSEMYHAYPQYGFTELVDGNGEWCMKEDERGEIVATGFNNPAMPLIRYRTQDIAVRAAGPCACGRNWMLIKRVEGRTQDYVIAGGGRPISLTALIHAQHFRAFERIKHMQLYQDTPGKVEVRIVEYDPLGPTEKDEIVAKMESAADGGLEVNLRIVNHIPRTGMGKLNFLIQKLDVGVDPMRADVGSGSDGPA